MYYNNLKFKIVFFFIFLTFQSFTQAVFDTKLVIDSFIVFKDAKESNLWYYAPGDLKLKKKTDGSPDLQMVSLRYTGTNLYGDKGSLRYRNIIQLTILMQQFSTEDLSGLKRKLKFKGGDRLIPLPISNLETTLLTSAGNSSDGKPTKLGTLATSNASGQGKGLFWSERSFALALDNIEAQLIENQLKNNRLAFSFSYNFYAPMMAGKIGDIAVEGDTVLAEQLKNQVETIDSTLADVLIKGNTFGISIDLNEFPNVAKKIDLNEQSMLPTYAVLNVQCFDFNNNIRPDLFFKTVEFEAKGVGGEAVRTQVKFAKNSADITSQTVQFEYAVRINQPLRYRLIETNDKGERIVGNWTALAQWKPMIDISSDADKLDIETRQLDFELEQTTIQNAYIKAINIWVKYTLLGKTITELIDATTAENEGIFKSINIRQDKKTPIRYQFIYKTDKGIEKKYWRTITNDYTLLKI